MNIKNFLFEKEIKNIFTIHTFSSTNTIKPWQNKKDQTFVEIHRFFSPYLNFNLQPAAKKGFKNGAFQQTFGPSYFDRALPINNLLSAKNWKQVYNITFEMLPILTQGWQQVWKSEVASSYMVGIICPPWLR